MLEDDFIIQRKPDKKRSILARVQNTWRKDLPGKLNQKLIQMIGLLSMKLGGDTYASDGMLLWGREIGWIEDHILIKSISKVKPVKNELRICWRTHVLCWAAKQAINSEGDFFEFGCFKGFSAAVVRHYCGSEFNKQGSRNYFWFDLFQTSDTQKIGNPLDFCDAESIAISRASLFEDIKIIKGDIRETYLNNNLYSDKKIAFAHFDLNNIDVEIQIIDYVMQRVTSGSVIVFDDFAMSPFSKQNREYYKFFRKLSIPILELPTGQGVVIIP